MVEIYLNFQSDNGTLTPGQYQTALKLKAGEFNLIFLIDHALQQWSARYLESMNGLKDLRAATRLPNLMREAGFVDVESRMITVPTCAWSSVK
jgi:hypothetical protein